MTKQIKRGFTLVEMMVVISIVGFLASVILSSVNSTRAKGENTQRNNVVEEYRKALTLAYDRDGGYPYPGATGLLTCLGDYPTLGDYTSSIVCGAALAANPFPNSENSTVTNAIRDYIPGLPTLKLLNYTNLGVAYKFQGPAYWCFTYNGSQCTSARIRWRISGFNQVCPRGAVVNTFSSDSTLCTLSLD